MDSLGERLERICFDSVSEKRARWSSIWTAPDSMAAVVVGRGSGLGPLPLWLPPSGFMGASSSVGTSAGRPDDVGGGDSIVQLRFCFLMNGFGMSDGLAGRFDML